jgi:DNA topoisomerase-1
MALVIVESPAKCKKIQGFLGDGWTVIASMGHIRALESELDAIGLDRDFDARFAFQKEKAKAIQAIKAAAKGMKEIYLAADDDREGEAIAYSVAVLLGLDPKVAKRAVFHEITKTAITKAVREPRLLDMNKVDAQQARAILDMMVGFTISPLLWTYVGNALSAGRCQTPALRLVVEKEAQIQSFTSQTTWKLSGSWCKGTLPLQATLVDDLEDEESARNFLENICEDAGGTVTSTVTKPWVHSAPKPLITSTLQQESSARFTCNPKKTMMIAQRLYEAGHITYMRTDHAILSGEAILAAKELLRKEFGDAYVIDEVITKKGGKADVKAQEAHEAIRPTHFELTDLPTTEDWSAVDRKIYKLIRDRALQSVMTPCKGEEHTIVFLADGDPAEFPWATKWKRTTFLGWKRIGVAEANLDGDEEETDDDSEAIWARATSIKVGDKLKWTSLEAFPLVTKPPGRFNEATLVRELEKKGIGRPSTFAMLISTIMDKEYVKKETYPAREIKIKHLMLSSVGQKEPTEIEKIKKIGAEKEKLAPTDLGKRILEFCLREFSGLFDYAFTSRMETRLDSIAEGKEPWKQLCRDTWSSYKDTVARLKKDGSSAEAKNTRVKEFEGGLKAVLSKKGPILLKEDESGDKDKTQFFGWIEGLKFEDMTAEIAATLVEKKGAVEDAWGEYDGQPIVLKSGPFGKYYQCGSLRIPAVEGDTVETVTGRLEAKKNSVLHTLGDFEFRTGQYGVFMFKKTVAKGKKPAFVGLPEGLDPKVLTEEAAIRIYQTGLQQKARSKAIGAATEDGAGTGHGGGRGGGRGGFGGRGHGGGRGGFGGRGRGRGRGRGGAAS